ncbi:MAG TPA: prolyl oligopeptidase family serine peptidase [Pirellulaceae bacterium]|nr:prolyl oligopeptidase family serine peptidase [Pirellulaceae bacterium]
MFRSCLALVFIMPSTLSAADADHRDRFEARTFDDRGFTLPYRLLKPQDLGARQKYPLVLFLHGAGERGNDNVKQLVHGMNDFASDEIMAKHPAFVVAPQCPEDRKWVEVDWTLDAHTLPESPSVSLEATIRLIESLQKEFTIDASRIYITGLSMGGYGTWDALARWPELFAAAAPICGGGDPAVAARFKDVPIWVFQGDEDTAVKPKRSREMVEALKAAGGQPKYTEYPGVAHDSWTQTYADPTLHEWLFSQRKP